MQPGEVTYSFDRYDTLRSLSYLGEQRKSMFRQDSIVPGSERLDRLVLWPTGVYSPGAMRQLGRHALAFVGRRHFDDLLFLDRMFTEMD